MKKFNFYFEKKKKVTTKGYFILPQVVYVPHCESLWGVKYLFKNKALLLKKYIYLHRAVRVPTTDPHPMIINASRDQNHSIFIFILNTYIHT